jgi:transcriptional regulator with XRE-family HTH domain
MPAIGPQYVRGNGELFGDPQLDLWGLDWPAQRSGDDRGVKAPGRGQLGERAMLLAQGRLYVLNVPTGTSHASRLDAQITAYVSSVSAVVSAPVKRKSSSHLDIRAYERERSAFLMNFRGLIRVGTADSEREQQFPPDEEQFPPGPGFGSRLRDARLAAGFKSARALGAAVGLSDSNIRLYEKEEQEPRLSVLVKLAAACGVGLDWLARGEGPMLYPVVGSTTAEGHAVERGPVVLFKSMDIERAVLALQMADAAFAQRQANPTARERVQVMALLYDQLTQQEEKQHNQMPPDQSK